jgi:hypothetical protein
MPTPLHDTFSALARILDLRHIVFVLSVPTQRQSQVRDKRHADPARLNAAGCARTECSSSENLRVSYLFEN